MTVHKIVVPQKDYQDEAYDVWRQRELDDEKFGEHAEPTLEGVRILLSGFLMSVGFGFIAFVLIKLWWSA